MHYTSTFIFGNKQKKAHQKLNSTGEERATNRPFCRFNIT